MRKCLLGLTALLLLAGPAWAETDYFLGGGEPAVRDGIEVTGWQRFEVTYQCWETDGCDYLIELFRGNSLTQKAQGTLECAHRRQNLVLLYTGAKNDPMRWHLKLTAGNNKVRFGVNNVGD